jgi:hypothetical protein
MSETVTIPRYLLPRLTLIAEKLDLNEKDALEALFDWAGVSLSLAEVLKIEELKSNVLYKQVEKLKEESVSTQYYPLAHQESMSTLGNKSFDAQSISDLCLSVKILSETLTQQKVMSKSEAKINQLNKDMFEEQGKDEQKKDYRRPEAYSEINHAIDKIMQFNEKPGRTYLDKFRVGVGSLRKLVNRGDILINKVIESRSDEIEQHHQNHQLFNTRHNAKGKTAPSIETVVFLDNPLRALP